MTVILFISFGFTLCYCIINSWFLNGWLRGNQPKATTARPDPFVSLIVCARNEQENIGNLIESVLKNTYSNFEFIIVDDYSSDKTGDIIKAFASVHSRIISVKTKDATTHFPKREALAEGIKIARGELVLFTDADCIVKNGWIQEMVSSYKNGNDFIIGPVAYTNEASILERLQSLHYIALQGIGGGSALCGNAVMCSGANLAIEIKVLKDLFTVIDTRAHAGEDMLLLDAYRNHYEKPVAFVKERNAIVSTFAQDSFKTFIWQQQRWASKNSRFTNKAIIAVMGLISAHYIFLLISLILSGFYDKFATLLIVQVLLYLCVDFISWWAFTAFFLKTKLLWNFITLQLLRIPFYMLIAVTSVAGKLTWKGRTLN